MVDVRACVCVFSPIVESPTVTEAVDSVEGRQEKSRKLVER